MRNLTYKDSEIMTPIYKALIRPIVEYGNPVWAPYLRKNINIIEKIQRHYTKRIIGMGNLDYKQRLCQLRLPSLEFRRVRGDMIEVYKIIHNIYDPITTHTLLTLTKEMPTTTTTTRSNGYKIDKTSFNNNQFKFYFCNRIINLWNSLPVEVASASSVNCFKNKIDQHLKAFTYDTKIDCLSFVNKKKYTSLIKNDPRNKTKQIPNKKSYKRPKPSL